MVHDLYRRPRRSAGSSRSYRRTGKLAEGALAADLDAVNANVALAVLGFIRADYGRYPRRFLVPRMIELYPDGIVARPFWSTLSWRAFEVTEDITQARVRPRDVKTDWNIRGTGNYAEDGSLSQQGMEVIACSTHRGTLELAVGRADVPLLLHYLNRG